MHGEILQKCQFVNDFIQHPILFTPQITFHVFPEQVALIYIERSKWEIVHVCLYGKCLNFITLIRLLLAIYNTIDLTVVRISFYGLS